MSAEVRDLPTARPQLTEREEQVMHAFGRGLSNKQVAAELELSQRTIEIHASHIRQKAGIPAGRAMFGLWYARTFPELSGMLPPPPRQQTELERDAGQLLRVIDGLMNGDPRARSMARVLLDKHAGELVQP